MQVRDEVCGMEIELGEAAGNVRHAGTVYYFCSERCRRFFAAHPEQYVSPGPGDDAGASRPTSP